MLTFKINKENYWLSGKIDSIGNDYIKINYDNTEIKVNEISAVKTQRSQFNYKASGSMLMSGGIIAPVIILLNGLIYGDRPLITKEFLMVSTGVILTGFLFKSLATKVHHIGKRKELKIVSL